MKKIIILFFLILPLFSFNVAHKFYLSVTEIEYNEENTSLQIISRVFTDDMENLLKTRYGKELYLTNKEEHPWADEYLEKYTSQKLRIMVDGKAYALNYLGKEYDNDQLVLYIEIEEIASFSSIVVQNEILTDLFPEQKNVVHVELKGKTKSLLLSREQEKGIINFDK